jgi:hypothetical protein
VEFSSNSKSSVIIDKPPTAPLEKPPVFLPSRELITLSGWFNSLYDNFNVEFEELWRDTISLLNAPTLKGPRAEAVRDVVRPIEEAIGGRVEFDQTTGRFYLRSDGSVGAPGRYEMPLVAEGQRKFAMVSRLVSTGVLLEHGYLFWDEPEANLNPSLVKTCARTIMALAEGGIQVFVATHSLFLLKELQILEAEKDDASGVTYFALSREGSSGQGSLSSSDHLEEVQPIVSFDEEIKQAGRYMRIG